MPMISFRSLNSAAIAMNGSMTLLAFFSSLMTSFERTSSFQKSPAPIWASRYSTLFAFWATSKITSQVLEFLLDHPDIFF
jgi:hypothetical protein